MSYKNNFTRMGNIFKDGKNIAIFVLAVLLFISIGANWYFFSSNNASHKDLDKLREEENGLLQRNSALEATNKAIQAQKDERTIAIDSLKKVIDGYEAAKKERKAQTGKTVKTVNGLSANESLDKFINWTDPK